MEYESLDMLVQNSVQNICTTRYVLCFEIFCYTRAIQILFWMSYYPVFQNNVFSEYLNAKWQTPLMREIYDQRIVPNMFYRIMQQKWGLEKNIWRHISITIIKCAIEKYVINNLRITDLFERFCLEIENYQ